VNAKSVTTYLFQVDSAKENRFFFEGMHKSLSESVYFRGLDFKVGPWTPDGIRVDLTFDSQQCSLTLIELEAIESTALKSSRKYLPEESVKICSAFIDYLDRVIKDCDARADQREFQIEQLKKLLSQNIPITVKTAGALRSDTTFLAEAVLTDQANGPEANAASGYHLHATRKIVSKELAMRGRLRLSPEESKGLRRCIQILDAIIRERDFSNTIFRHWRLKTPLKNLLGEMPEKPHTLADFVLNPQNKHASGIAIDFEAVLEELVGVWAKDGRQIELEDARKLVNDYFPLAMGIGSHDGMDHVFAAARIQVQRIYPQT
jgi:hypothetical protein